MVASCICGYLGDFNGISETEGMAHSCTTAEQ